MKFKQSSPSENSSKYKKQKTFWLCPKVYQVLSVKEWDGKRSKLVDYLLCKFFNISYEEAYGRKKEKDVGEERAWDFLGIYRKSDIENGRFIRKISGGKIRFILKQKGKEILIESPFSLSGTEVDFKDLIEQIKNYKKIEGECLIV